MLPEPHKSNKNIQPIRRRADQDFYNQVYAGPLFGTVLVGLLLFIVGGVFTGSAIAASGRLPRWAGWVYAVTTAGFVLSNFLLPVGQSVMAALLFAATAVVAWRAGREEHRRDEKSARPVDGEIM